MFNEISYYDDWDYCVSTSSSYMSLSWQEHFFKTKEDANKFYKTMEKNGYAVLMVDRDSY